MSLTGNAPRPHNENTPQGIMPVKIPSTVMPSFRNELLAAAQAFYEHGFLARPIVAGTKDPDGRWSKDRFPMADPPENRTWANRSGLWVRVPDGWVVVDCDTEESVTYWHERLGPDVIAKAAVSRAPNSRGPHLWFRLADGIEGANWSHEGDPVKFDIRGMRKGGVVAPPSEHHRGGRYEWVRPLSSVVPLTEDEAALLRKHTVNPQDPKVLPTVPAPRLPTEAEQRTATEDSGYGLKALRDEVAKIRSTPVGQALNNTINKSAYNIGQLVGGGELTEQTAREKIVQAALESGDNPVKDEDTALRGLKDGMEQPRNAPAPVASADATVSGKVVQSGVWSYDQTHLDEARRFRDMYGKDLRHVPGWGWMAWDGRRWVMDDKRPAQLVHDMTDYLKAEAAQLKGDAAWKMLSYVRGLQSLGNINAIVKTASVLAELHADVNQFDADPYKLLAGTGVIDLATGELLPLRREYLLTKGTNVEYDPDAKCDRFEDFLAWAFHGDRDMIEYVQTMFGMCLIGDNAHHVAFFLYGPGRSGKTTLSLILSKLLGDYSRSADLEVFSDPGSGHNDALARLAGARVVLLPEADHRNQISESRFKKMTGGEVLQASFKGKTGFQFKPAFVPVITGNSRPGIRFDTGIERRMKVIEMTAQITDGEKDPKLVERLLSTEGPGIMAFAVRGAMRIASGEFIEDPPQVKKAVQEWREETDHTNTFVEDELIFDASQEVASGELWARYELWVKNGGVDFTGRQKHAGLVTALKGWADRHGHSIDTRKGAKGKRFVTGVTLQK